MTNPDITVGREVHLDGQPRTIGTVVSIELSPTTKRTVCIVALVDNGPPRNEPWPLEKCRLVV